MPELPEVETTIRYLDSKVNGKKILSITTSKKKLRKNLHTTNLSAIEGSVIKLVDRKAKYIVLTLKPLKYLVIHLGMSGRLKFFNKKNYKIAIYQIIRDSIDIMIRDLLSNTEKNIKKFKIKSLKDVSKSNQLIVSFSDKIENSEQEIRSFLRHRMYDNKSVLNKNQRGKMIIKKLFKIIKSKPRN